MLLLLLQTYFARGNELFLTQVSAFCKKILESRFILNTYAEIIAWAESAVKTTFLAGNSNRPSY